MLSIYTNGAAFRKGLRMYALILLMTWRLTKKLQAPYMGWTHAKLRASLGQSQSHIFNTLAPKLVRGIGKGACCLRDAGMRVVERVTG